MSKAFLVYLTTEEIKLLKDLVSKDISVIKDDNVKTHLLEKFKDKLQYK